MPRIIKRVPFQLKEIPYSSASCKKCRGGYIISRNGKDVFPQNRKYLGKKCACGGTYELEAGFIIEKTPAHVIVECDCGEKIVCMGFTNTCPKCDADYNWNGERLAPRSQWGWETGEVF